MSEIIVFYVSEEFKNKKQVGYLFLDSKKTFCQYGLLSKRKSYGIRRSTIIWIQDYRGDRNQRSILNGIKLKYKKISPGIPQASVLRERVFLLFPNHIEQSSPSAN